MIVSEEITILPRGVSFVDGRVRVFSKLNKGDRPADIVFDLGEDQIVEHDFAELRFDENAGSLVPKIEVVRWSRFFIFMGVRRWIFSMKRLVQFIVFSIFIVVITTIRGITKQHSMFVTDFF